jgi:serine/threonine protein kinase
MNCPQCQQSLRDTAQFCDACGLSLDASDGRAKAAAPSDLDATLRRKDPLIGQLLDSKYELVSLLGAGRMGAVYRARRVHIGDEVAVKVLNQEFLTQEQAIERFRREARAAAMLRHANVVRIYDFGEGSDEGLPAFIVMELLEGESLRTLLKGQGRLEPTRAVSLMSDICAGVGAAHRHGIVHRDLKPDNVIVMPPSDEQEREIVKVVDFGIAKLCDFPGVSTLTEVGTVFGTPYYMSPEQCRGESLDARSDVYSLGAMFYEMVADRPPFTADTVPGVVAKHLTDPPPPLPQALGVPQPLEAVVMRALAKNADERPADALEFARLLKEGLISTGEGARLAGDVPSRELSSANAASSTGPVLSSSTGSVVSDANLPTKKRQLGRSFVLGAALLLVSVIAFGLYKFVGHRRTEMQPASPKSEGSVVHADVQKLYWQMSDSEQSEFIGQRAQRVSTTLGPNPYNFDQASIVRIKEEMNYYVARKDSLSPELFYEALRPLYSRASIYAPFIINAFDERRVPSVIGLYIAMIETEYHPCIEGQFGGKGLFAFAAKTALNYGVDPNDRCDPQKMSHAAAHYIDDLRAEFGSDSGSVTLAILSYNRGEARVRGDLHLLLNAGIRERSYWTLAANADKLDQQFQQEAIRYVAKFFAAAIIGEKPEVFDLQVQPLSTYTKVQPNVNEALQPSH